MPEILITHPISDASATFLRGVSPQCHITLLPATRPEDVSPEIWARIEILFTETVLPQPEHAQKLKWIQFLYSGIDRWVDHPLFHKPGIQLTTLSGAAVSQMAEHAVMMMLVLGHKLPALMSSQRKSEWPKDRAEKFIPKEIREATIGIVGYGSVGRQIARLLEPFGGTILATKRDAKSPDDTGFTKDGLGDPAGSLVHRLYPAEALNSILRLSDFIFVCVPLTPSTKGLLGTAAFGQMKNGAFLIDISRGRVVDQISLIKALQEGRLAGAALDVFAEEPLPADNPLWGFPNVIITPHIADNSRNYEQQACELFSENLHRYLAGLPLFNVYNSEWGY
jgi:phosphoglycerate dehydrogenase-like enzyme